MSQTRILQILQRSKTGMRAKTIALVLGIKNPYAQLSTLYRRGEVYKVIMGSGGANGSYRYILPKHIDPARHKKHTEKIYYEY